MPPSPLVTKGAIWSSPNNVAGIGGGNVEVSLGQFDILPIVSSEVSTLYLTKHYTQQLTPAGGGEDANIAARIVYGIGAASDEFLMDWSNGCAVSLPSGTGHVTVYAKQRSPWLDGGNPGMNKGVRLTAMLARGSRSGQMGPTLTQVWNFAGAGTVQVPIPARARRLMVESSLGSASDLVVDIITSAGVFSRFKLNEANGMVRYGGIPLDGNSVAVNITSAGAELIPFVILWVLDG